ncbi:hypothetical protein CLOP_g4350 [Closterium sp. NIES-67]|nr:hypothetical protein CLOP_g4350 [Closterium sp. NIES-67]
MGRGGGESESRAGTECSLELRPATADDYEHYVTFFPELSLPASLLLPFDTWQRDLAPSTYFLAASGGDGLAGGDGESVAKSDCAPLAYVYVETLRDTGFIRHLVVHPGRRRQGMGTKLMRAVAARLAAAGCGQWRLNVFPSNTAAIRLYSHLGLSPLHSGTCLQISWERLASLPQEHPVSCNEKQARAVSLECEGESCAGENGRCGGGRASMLCCEGRSLEEGTGPDRQLGGWKDSGCERVTVGGIEAGEEEQVEREMGLPLGLLQRMRALKGTLLAKAVATRDAGGCGAVSRAQCEGVGGIENSNAKCRCSSVTDEDDFRVLGLACYQEGYGGFKIFRASSPALAQQLLQWFDQQLPGKIGTCTLLVEASGGAVEWLKAMGATTKYNVIQMAGNVPTNA